ncbi:MAG: glycosyltransferase [Clostridia bacterium]|nr:glycosyltransferase [Clostridia bacterium]
MSAPKVSIIVPVYNTEKYLKQCIDSITSQTLRDIEIIVVDDGSEEKCALLCDELALTDSRIKVIHKANAGSGFARNTGLEVASGEYVGFIDSDDYIKPEMYASLYSAAANNDADIAISGICFVGGNTFNQEGDYSEKHYFDKNTVFEGEDLKELLLGVVGALPHESEDSRYGVSVCKNIFKRSLICEKDLRFPSERQFMSEDTLFMVDFLKHAKKAFGIHGAFYCYRRNDASISKSYKIDRLEKTITFLTELEARVSAFLPKEEYRLYFDRLVQGYGRILCSQEIMHAKDCGIKYRDLKKRLMRICTQEKMAEVLSTYPWHQLPKKQAAFAFAMKYKLYLAQKLMVILRAR